MLDHTQASGQGETIASFGRITLLHPPYSPDLVPSNYHLFDPMKEVLRGKHYTSDEEVKTAVMKYLKEHSTEFYEDGIHALIRKWKLLLRETLTMLRSRHVIQRGLA